MALYLNYEQYTTTSIDAKFERYNNATLIAPHMHHHYEFVLIQKGTCIHTFRGVKVPLIAGDVFLVPPDEEHGYTVNAGTVIANGYFYPQNLTSFSRYISESSLAEMQNVKGLNDVQEQWEELLRDIHPEHTLYHTSPIKEQKNRNRANQGILHLEPAVAMHVEELLSQIASETLTHRLDSEHMKAGLLQMILVYFRRELAHVPQILPGQGDEKKRMLLHTLTYLNGHYADPITVTEMAEMSSLSVSYFRTVFKEVTGVSPIDYLNRIRIARAMELIQSSGYSIQEAAEQVGILDANYFTRLFKKTLGYPPRYFRKNTVGHTGTDTLLNHGS